ncbi:phasin family protein [Methylobacterium frigidaeris]|uniref:Phasin domain-containing protein n=1 Tax=Methylobacterium frigidaeris TaxID=2038277 RepID=A0AA37H6A3_9HYPH|nr:phasin family protein [Methylobacterium frigidaeris]PIK68490.1 hypothetical protein CS379_34795 [Methylobacterium frigidaeris]GJD59938.1 hypothetical protein MPEAHAMD_0069 [Methylobacterium frigidaeris]
MTTTRRIDRTRKPPRRTPVRAAARTNDSAKSGETGASETTSDEAMIAAGTHEAATGAEQPETEQPGSAPTSEVEDAPEDASAAEAGAEDSAAPVAAAGTEIRAEGSSEGASVEEPVAEAPVAQAAAVEAAGDAQASVQESDVPDAAAPAETPVAEPATGEAPAVATSDEPAAAPEQPGPRGREEVPLAAMQGFIEINGRLVAFLQGESQAALAFWKAALAVRSPGDLAQLQAAEMSRAVDAALACWTDLARRMGRFPAFVAPRARAA